MYILIGLCLTRSTIVQIAVTVLPKFGHRPASVLINKLFVVYYVCLQINRALIIVLNESGLDNRKNGASEDLNLVEFIFVLILILVIGFIVVLELIFFGLELRFIRRIAAFPQI